MLYQYRGTNRKNRLGGEQQMNSFFVKKNGELRFDWLKKFRSWWIGSKSFAKGILRVSAAKQGVIVIGVILLISYIMSAFYTEAGEFVIRVDHPGEKWLVLSDTQDFSEELIVLNGEAIAAADNISIFSIAPDVADIDGEHNGPNYVAYTFYLKNIGYDIIDYTYSLSIERATKGIEEATWVMLYHNGKQQIFAKENKSGGEETQSSSFEFPFLDAARKPELYEFDEESGMYTLRTEEFASSRIAATSVREGFGPQEIDKFTVVIWLEGEDPECIDNILGGSIEFAMQFKY